MLEGIIDKIAITRIDSKTGCTLGVFQRSHCGYIYSPKCFHCWSVLRSKCENVTALCSFHVCEGYTVQTETEEEVNVTVPKYLSFS